MLIIFLIILLFSLFLLYKYFNNEYFTNNEDYYKIINNKDKYILTKNRNNIIEFNKLKCNDNKIKIIKTKIPFIYNIYLYDKKYDFYIENHNEFKIKLNNKDIYNVFFSLINNKEIITIRNPNFDKLCNIKSLNKNDYIIDSLNNFDYKLGLICFTLIKHINKLNLC